MSWLLASVGQSIGVSASASVLPMNTQDWSPLGWTAWISLQFKGLSRVFSNTTVQKYQFFSTQSSLWSNSHIHTCLLENHSLDYTDIFQQSDVSAFKNTVQVCHCFSPMEHLLISRLHSPSAEILEPKKIKCLTVSMFPHLFVIKWWDWMHDLHFLNVEL